MAEQAAAAKTVDGKAAAVPVPVPVAKVVVPPVHPRVMLDNLWARLTTMSAAQRNWLMASAAFLLAVIAGMAWYAQRPDWRTLFSGLDSRDTAQVTQEITAAGIENRTSADGGSVEVPADAVDKARIEVAAKGMPQSGRMGFELFDKPNWVGSEFDEQVAYQRALEGELEHTIQTLGVVRSARVHLVLPQRSLFAAEDKVAKASVVLKLKRQTVDQAEADSIRSLVAGAVPNLSPADVVLVDSDGRVNLKPHSQSMAEGDVEQALEAKLVSLLEPLAGRDNVRATVRVSYDQSSEDRVDEVYDPTQVAATQMQRSEQTATQAAKPSGVPGTASNTPAASPKGAVQGSTAAAAPGTPPLLNKDAATKDGVPVYPQAGAGGGQSVKQESGTYAVTKHTTHMELSPGRVGRVTAAVLVNDRMVSEGTGKAMKTVWKPRSPEEIHRLEELAQAAVGYDAKRGDQVVVENMGFSGNAPEAPVPILDKMTDGAKGFLHSQPGLMRTLMLGACGVLLVMFVLRPVAGQMMETLREPPMLSAGKRVATGVRQIGPGGLVEDAAHGAAALGSAGHGERQIALGEGQGTQVDDISPAKKKGKHAAQAIFDSVTENIQNDATPSTRLIRGWIASGGAEAT